MGMASTTPTCVQAGRRWGRDPRHHLVEAGRTQDSAVPMTVPSVQPSLARPCPGVAVWEAQARLGGS